MRILAGAVPPNVAEAGIGGKLPERATTAHRRDRRRPHQLERPRSRSNDQRVDDCNSFTYGRAAFGKTGPAMEQKGRSPTWQYTTFPEDATRIPAPVSCSERRSPRPFRLGRVEVALYSPAVATATTLHVLRNVFSTPQFAPPPRAHISRAASLAISALVCPTTNPLQPSDQLTAWAP